jgi:HAD superfamily hydrolase (TIGR01450 family)
MAKQDADWAVQQYEAVRPLLPKATMPVRSNRAADLEEIADHIDVFLLDAFGVLNVGGSAIDGAAACVSSLKAMGKRVLVLTNGARVPADQAVAKFENLGFDLTLSDIVSSRDAMTAHLKDWQIDGFWGAMCAGNSRMETVGVPWRRLEDDPQVYAEASGFLLVSAAEWSSAQQDLLRASLIENPRPVLVGNPDIVAPREYGLSLEPGYFAYELIRELGLDAGLFGKPFGNIFDLAFSRLGDVDKKRVAMVGDTLHTDVLGGAAYGVQTVLVTDHGLFAGQDYADFIARTKIVPDYIIPSI